MQEQGTLQLQNHMWWFKRWANELAMICQRFTHVECFEVQISIAQANGTQGLIPPSVIKINTMTITGELKRRVEGRTALIKLIWSEQYTSEVWRLQQTWVGWYSSFQQSSWVHRAGIWHCRVGAALAAFFRWSLGLLAPDNLHSSGQCSGTAEYTVQARALPKERKGSSIIWFWWGKIEGRKRRMLGCACEPCQTLQTCPQG